MKKIVVVLLFLCAAAFFWQDLVGLALKGVLRFAMKAKLAYRDLSVTRDGIVMEDVVLFDVSGGKSVYLVRADRVQIEWEKSLSFFVRCDKSYLTLSADVLHYRWNPSSTSSYISCKLEIPEGIIEWSDRCLPESTFSLLDDELNVFWAGGGAFSASKTEDGYRLVGTGVPIHLVWPQTRGLVDGSVDLALPSQGGCALTCKLQGTELFWHTGLFDVGGSVALDWTAKDLPDVSAEKLFHATEAIRLQIDHLVVSEVLQEGACSLTFQKGVGGEWSGAAKTRPGLDLAMAGRLMESRPLHSVGMVRFGEMEARIAQDEARVGERWLVSWKHLGAPEIRWMQELASRFYPAVSQGLWVQGTVEGSGGVDLRGAWDCTDLKIEQVEGRFGEWMTSCEQIVMHEGVWDVEKLCYRTPSMSAEYGSGRLVPVVEPEESRWAFACTAKEGQVQWDNVPFFAKTPALQGKLYVGLDEWEISGVRGEIEGWMGAKSLSMHCRVPHIRWREGGMSFDVRLGEDTWDVCRVVGSLQKDRIDLDPLRSFFLGAPLEVQGTFEECQAKTSIAWQPFASWMSKKGYAIAWAPEFDGTLQLKCHTGKGFHVSVDSPDCTWRGQTLPLYLEGMEEKRGFRISSLTLGPFVGQCLLSRERDIWQLREGKIRAKEALALDFEGTVNQDFRVNAVLDHLTLDLAEWTSFQGTVEGKGCVSYHSEWAADLDVNMRHLMWEEYAIENSGPLHCSLTSSGKVLLKGIESKIFSRDLEGHLAMDLLEMDLRTVGKSLRMQKIRSLIPTNWLEQLPFDRDREVVLCGDAKFQMDDSGWACELQEAFFPFAESVRHVKDCRFGYDEAMYAGGTRVFHQGHEAAISWKIDADSRGQIVLQEAGLNESMAIAGSYENGQLLLESIEGKFAGVSASFREVEKAHLMGSARFHFGTLSEWIPKVVADVFHDLEMGDGYEVKGNLHLLPNDFSFKGLFCGKEIDLFGFQFRTLMAEAEFNRSKIHLKDLLISDAAGSLKIPEILLEEVNAPWTMQIPELKIYDLRPSLLRKIGEAPGALTPLVVRELKMTDFRGFLEDGATYRATGELSFLNSFKRGKSVFDLPTHLFGRIVGLDLELLIPVEGHLLFKVENGYFVLTELQESFSEGRRSQFFLVDENIPPRMSLRGDLEIFVRMKHFVLFALTEPFLISINGKLSDPKFHLQKKKTE